MGRRPPLSRQPDFRLLGRSVGSYGRALDRRRSHGCRLGYAQGLPRDRARGAMGHGGAVPGLGMARARASLFAPLHVAALATGAKSFRDNPVIGSERLNRNGLHVARMKLAAEMAASRRARLDDLVSAEDRAAFARDGYIEKRGFLPGAVFDALRNEAMGRDAPARDMIQGDTVTRRIALDRVLLRDRPALRALTEDPAWLGLIRYVGASSLEPLTYIQTIFPRVRPG